MKTIRLGDIAYARSGDKGNSANIGVIAKTENYFAVIKMQLTSEKMKSFFAELPVQDVKRYELPNLWALNFVLEGILDGGGSRSLRTDSQGKALGQAILEMKIEIME